MSWLGTWANRIKLTIDSSKIDTADLTDFPVLVKLSTASGIGDVDVSAVFDELTSDANRKKIAVTSSDGTTQLYCEIEKWDDASEEAWLHVKVPTVDYDADTIIYLYYDSSQSDNTSYIGDTTDAVTHNVWDSNFAAVYHMAQDPNGDGADAVKDSTSNANDGTPAGTMLTEDLISGQVDGSIEFDGTDDLIEIDDHSTLDITSGLTLEAIVNRDSGVTAFADGEGIVAKYAGSGGYTNQRSYKLILTSDGYANFTVSDDGAYDATGDLSDNLDVADGNNHYLAGVYVPSTSQTIYADGVQRVQDTSSILASIYSGSAPLWLACDYNNTNPDLYFAGSIDEVRISSTARSASWIKATYNSLWDSLITFGAEETPTGLAVSSFIPSFGIEGTSVVITGTEFTGATSVTFGGTEAASFVVDSDTQITAVAGTGATGVISVTTSSGTASSVSPYTFNPTCDNWTFAMTGGATIEKEDVFVRTPGGSSIKITLGTYGAGSASISQTVNTDVGDGTVGYAIVTFYVYWNGTGSLRLYASYPGFNPYYKDVPSLAEWQEVTIEIEFNGWIAKTHTFGVFQYGWQTEGEIFYIDGPISVTKSSMSPIDYTKIKLESGSPFTYDPNCTIIGTTNYDGSYTALQSVDTEFVIRQTYVAETPNGVTEKAYVSTYAITEQNVTGHVVDATVDSSFRLYDNGIPITDNYIPWARDVQSFSLSAEPTGPVTISGTGTLTTLDEVMAAVAVIAGLSYNNDSARSPSPEIATVITTQSSLIDYITSLCEFYTHMTYILSDTLYLIDGKGINQEHPSGVTLTEHDFFSIAYNGRTYLKEIRSAWTVKIMTVGLPNAGTIYILEDEEREVSANLVFLLSDTVTSIATNKLIDGVATFDTDGTVTGQYVKNLNTGDLAEVTTVDSETQLTLDADIFAALETTVWESGTIWESGTTWGFESLPRYTIGEIFSSGSEMDITAYHQEKENVLDAILDIQEIVVAHKMEVHMPMKISTWLLPGELLILTDTRKLQDISVQMKIRSLKYDFNNYTIIVTGEGSIS